MKNAKFKDLSPDTIFRFKGKKTVYLFHGRTRGRNTKFLYGKMDDISAQFETTNSFRDVEIDFEY